MTDLFNDDQVDQPQIDPQKNYLEELVGPGKKFATPEDMAKGKYLADELIKFKEKEYDRLREDYLKLKGERDTKAILEELLTKNAQKPVDNNPPPVAQESKPFDPKQVEDLIQQRINESKTIERQNANQQLVIEKLKERYGDSYTSVLKKQIDSLGLSENFVTNMAKDYPQVLMKTLGLDQPVQRETFQSPMNSSVRTDNFAPTGRETKGWSYYEKLRVEKPQVYTDPKTQIELFNAIRTMGEDKFYGS